MSAERLGRLVTLALVLAALDPARGTDATHPPEGPQERGSAQKGRLSLQNTGKRRPAGEGPAGAPQRSEVPPGAGAPGRAELRAAGVRSGGRGGSAGRAARAGGG